MRQITMRHKAYVIGFIGLLLRCGWVGAEGHPDQRAKIESFMDEYIQLTMCCYNKPGTEPSCKPVYDSLAIKQKGKEFVGLAKENTDTLERLLFWGQAWEKDKEGLVLYMCLPPLDTAMEESQVLAFLQKHVAQDTSRFGGGIRRALLSTLAKKLAASLKEGHKNIAFRQKVANAFFAQYNLHNNLALPWGAALGDVRVLDKIDKCLAAVPKSSSQDSFPTEENLGAWKSFVERGCCDNEYYGPAGCESGLENMEAALRAFVSQEPRLKTRARQLLTTYEKHIGGLQKTRNNAAPRK